MYSNHLLTTMAKERANSLAAHGDAARLAKLARSHRRLARRTPPPLPTFPPAGPVVLHDGSRVLIRPLTSDDSPLLADGFARLSPESRRLRFLIQKDVLSPAELRYLSDVDHRDHEALGALSQADGRGVGVARYIRNVEDPLSAEIAITVVDEWQRRGLGGELLDRLTQRACQEGIRRFTALVAADNVAIIKLMNSLDGPVALIDREEGALEYEIGISPLA